MAVRETAAALVFTSLFSATGAFLLFLGEEEFDALMPYLVSLAAGTILGGVFIHLIFRMANRFSYTRIAGLLVLAGMVGSFLLERAVHWHCHHRDAHGEPLAYVLAAGDAVHNVLDGLLIAVGFLASGSAGIAATAAVVAHKVPKELGDFGVLVDSGFSRLRALLFNVGISLFMFAGAAAALGLARLSDSAVPVLLPLVAGNFVYIAGSDLLPQFKQQENWVKHLLVFSLGILLMYLVPFARGVV